MRRNRSFFRPQLERLEDRNAPVGHDVGALSDWLSPAFAASNRENEIAPPPASYVD